MAIRSTRRSSSDTRARILDATEALFIENGYDAMSLRQITSHAEVNLAAVNYHFGSKEALMHEMLSGRLDPLNQQRLILLQRITGAAATPPTCEQVLGAMFIPALRQARDPQQGGKAFLRLLGRAYSDPSAFIRDFLATHYDTTAERFFAAFQQALPHLPREELGWRLHFAIGALSGVLADASSDALLSRFASGDTLGDLQRVARLASLMVASLEAPLPNASRLSSFMALLGDAAEDASIHAPIVPDTPDASRPLTPAPVTPRHRTRHICSMAEQLVVRAIDPVRHSAHRFAPVIRNRAFRPN
ncbi:TetR/AcrR family transcriptional regulator [Paraburkholderia hayleyella]|uniref:TetR/AcrR family transcriptional regulator n=1 Tax=Paraburkholderia hayleyella TaxID=2152889 RepID=UPI0012929FAC|nr:TetR/AcrR family transcriptional regulator [Paraburkholderia hayleyella]